MALPPLDEDFQTVLVVAAHPDDIEYGTAAAVARWTTAGKAVTYLLATRGEAGIDSLSPAEAGPLRAQEEIDGAAKVGVDVVDFLDYRDGVVEYSLGLRRDIARVIRTRKPDVVVTGSFDVTFAGGMLNQADHRAVGLAVTDAARDAGNRWVFPELADEGLEKWQPSTLLITAGNDSNYGIDVTDTFDDAVASLDAHAAYFEGLPPGYPTPRQLLEMILGGGGQATGTRYGLPVQALSL